MIDLGIDESERSAAGNSKVLVVSALIGQCSRMEKLHRKWEDDLAEYGVDYFHATEHWNRRSRHYHGISMRKREELLRRLIDHIQKFSNVGLSVHIDPQEYLETTSNRFRSQWGSPYAFAIQVLAIAIRLELMEHEKLGKGQEREPVNILIEDGHKNSKQALEIIQNAVNREDAMINVRSVRLGCKSGNPMLQAADMVAYSNGEEVATGKSRILDQLANAGRVGTANHVQFKRLKCTNEAVELLKQGIEAELERRREARNQTRSPSVTTSVQVERERK